ncbi:hypothetical protein NE237_020559 [Protea cynaroides]|uniref:MEKHLA domain-containing protein n=1 Tax=Protea cynaroides TaxID=273540 RepID=A0A9Q0K1S4_9MAGN|nr:hypothetical protein NE237_020559 [Protea cynaroides]
MCCSLKTNASPVFTFANQAGFDMLETTLVALQDIMLDKILNDAGRKVLCSEFCKITQQVIEDEVFPDGNVLQKGRCSMLCMQWIAWKIYGERIAQNLNPKDG